jgi:hypothetical protein
VLIEVAHVAVRMDCRFKDMFWRITSRRCKKVAYVAVARKLLTIIWHLLSNAEVYVEEFFSKSTAATLVRSTAVVKSGYSRSSGGDKSGLSLEDIVGVLSRAVKAVSDVGG